MAAGRLRPDRDHDDMASKLHKILLTGPPGCGKTTAVKKIIGSLGKMNVTGFYTEEIREAGRRKGFRWRRLDGRSGTLAHTDIKSRYRVGKYGVDLDTFDKEVVPALDPDASGIDLFVVDEIGRMECFSEKFVEAIRRLFGTRVPVLATVALKGGGLIQEVKSHPAVRLLHLTVDNRDEITRQVVDMLTAPAGK